MFLYRRLIAAGRRSEETVRLCLNRQVTQLPSVISTAYSTVNSIFVFPDTSVRITATELARVYSTDTHFERTMHSFYCQYA
jgi:hypothetical protein